MVVEKPKTIEAHEAIDAQITAAVNAAAAQEATQTDRPGDQWQERVRDIAAANAQRDR